MGVFCFRASSTKTKDTSIRASEARKCDGDKNTPLQFWLRLQEIVGHTTGQNCYHRQN